MNNRKKLYINILISVLFIIVLIILNKVISDAGLQTNVKSKNVAPAFNHLFGTDWLGRDMLTRIVKGLNLSMKVGLLGAGIGVVIAIALGVLSGTFGGFVDDLVSYLVDVFIGMPHIVFIILISIMVGGGAKGVIFGVAFTHWPGLTRIIRAEVLQLKNKDYIILSRSFGKSNFYIARKHFMPHIIQQAMVGFLLLFPHAILHESALTFLGFGLPAQTPAIGIILSESIGHMMSGKWWLVIFPGVLLLLLVKSFDNIGENLRVLTDPNSSHT